MSTRLRKLAGDISAAPGRFAMMIIAIALSSAAITAMLFAYVVLTREMNRNYLATNPAAAQIVVSNNLLDVSANNILQKILQNPSVTAAEIGGLAYFQVEVSPKKFVMALIYVVPDIAKSQINKARLDKGEWPAEGDILLERKALGVAKLALGDHIQLRGQDSEIHSLKISGLVHDPALAPADTEHLIYGYMSQATFSKLHEPLAKNYIKITLRPELMTSTSIERVSAELAKNLAPLVDIKEIQIPPPKQHPHQTQMTSGLRMLLLFSILAVLLGALLIATIIWGMLTQQVRQIGIMKTLGASARQIIMLYLTLLTGLGLVALVLGFPLGIMAGSSLVAMTADLLNLEIIDKSIPLNLWLLNVVFCLGLPALFAFFPISTAAAKTVRAALDDYGVSQVTKQTTRNSFAFLSPLWVMLVRNLARRKMRLSFTLFLLAVAGATFLSSQNLLASWDDLAKAAQQHRHYQIEASIPDTNSIDAIQSLLKKTPGIKSTEFFYRSPASATRADGLIFKQVYPDGGHGSLILFGMNPETKMMSLDMQSGHWLTSTADDELVVNQTAYQHFFHDKKLGDAIYIQTNNGNRTFHLVGIINEPLTGASIYCHNAEQTPNAVRISLTNAELTTIEKMAAQLTQDFKAANISLGGMTTENFRQQSGNGHLMIMVLILVMIAIAMIAVGFFSLATVMSANVSERLREFAVMRTLGAKNSTVFSLVINEALLITLNSYFLTIPFAALFSVLMLRTLSNISAQPLSLVLSVNGLIAWLIIVVAGAVVASVLPALNATRFTIREALTFL